MSVANTLAYCGKATITVVISFKVPGPEVLSIMLPLILGHIHVLFYWTTELFI